MRSYPGGQYSPDLVQKYTGSAYDQLAKIAENLTDILAAGQNMSQLQDLLFYRFTVMANQLVFQGDDVLGRNLLIPGSLIQVYADRVLQPASRYVVESAGTVLRMLLQLPAGTELLVSRYSYNTNGTLCFDPILSQANIANIISETETVLATAVSARDAVVASVASAAASQAAALASEQAAELVKTYVQTVEATLPQWRGAWTNGIAYESGDLARENGATYICLTDHTSTVFANDLIANLWTIFADKGAAGAGSGDMLAVNNLSDLTNSAQAVANLGLGSAALTAATNYATAAQGVKADGAIPAVGQAKITDFNAIDTTRSAQFWADNAATNGPGIAEEFAVTYTRREAGSGFTLALSVESGRLFLRRRKNATWGAWNEFNGALARIETTDADLATRSGAYRLQNTCANLPSVNPFECFVASPNGMDIAQVAIRATDGQMWRRIRTGGAWTAWVRLVDASNVDALTNVPFINQNVVDVSASRAWDTTYQNTTSRPIFVIVEATSVQTYSWDFRLSPDGVAWQVTRVAASKSWSDGGILNHFVPPGWYYKLQKNSGTVPGLVWREMK